jgi:CBS domain-containing protein
MRARDLMSTPVMTVSPVHSIQHAAEIMASRGFSGLPVVDETDRLVGIITEGDLMRRKELGASPRRGMVDRETAADAYVRTHSWRVGDVMSAPCLTVTEDASTAEIAQLFLDKGVKRMPVLRGDTIVGIISRGDLLRAIVAMPRELIPPGSDSVRRAVHARLMYEIGVGLDGVSVIVADDVVHLWGDVQSEAERTAARVAAEEVPGVRMVVDHLRIFRDALEE